jgi:hypothetical protein
MYNIRVLSAEPMPIKLKMKILQDGKISFLLQESIKAWQ